jgi:hypothetical protein
MLAIWVFFFFSVQSPNLLRGGHASSSCLSFPTLHVGIVRSLGRYVRGQITITDCVSTHLRFPRLAPEFSFPSDFEEDEFRGNILDVKFISKKLAPVKNEGRIYVNTEINVAFPHDHVSAAGMFISIHKTYVMGWTRYQNSYEIFGF